MFEESRRFWRAYWRLHWLLFALGILAAAAVDLLLQPWFDLFSIPALVSAPLFILIEVLHLRKVEPVRMAKFRDLAASNPRATWSFMLGEVRYAPHRMGSVESVQWFENNRPTGGNSEEALMASQIVKREIAWASYRHEAVTLLKFLTDWVRANPHDESYGVVRQRLEKARRRLQAYHPNEFKEVRENQLT